MTVEGAKHFNGVIALFFAPSVQRSVGAGVSYRPRPGDLIARTPELVRA